MHHRVVRVCACTTYMAYTIKAKSLQACGHRRGGSGMQTSGTYCSWLMKLILCLLIWANPQKHNSLGNLRLYADPVYNFRSAENVRRMFTLTSSDVEQPVCLSVLLNNVSRICSTSTAHQSAVLTDGTNISDSIKTFASESRHACGA